MNKSGLIKYKIVRTIRAYLMLIVIAALSSTVSLLSAGIETFQKTYGSDLSEVGYCMLEYNGYYYLAGSSYFGGSDLNPCLVKTDLNGNMISKNVLPKAEPIDERQDVFYFEMFNGILPWKDGIYVSARRTLYKIDADGNTIESLSCPFFSKGIYMPADGKMLIYGDKSSIVQAEDMSAIGYKTDEEGSRNFKKKGYDDSDGNIRCLNEIEGSGYVFAEYNEGDVRVSLKNISYKGNILWALKCPNETISSIAVLADNCIIVLGRKYMTGASRKVDYITKIDLKGEIKWEKELKDSFKCNLGCIKVSGSGELFIAGYTGYKTVGENDAVLIKLNSDGDMLWTRTFGGRLFDFVNTIYLTNDNGIALLGGSNSFSENGNYEFYFLKIDGNGNDKDRTAKERDFKNCFKKVTAKGWVKYNDFYID